MTSSNSKLHPIVRRTRGVLAALAVVGFAGVAIVAPLANPSSALADDEFYERINQQFVPADVQPILIDLATSNAEELPPEPEPEPEPSTSGGGGGGGGLPPYTGGGSPAEWMAAAGIAESDWPYVDYIVSRESGWNPNAVNSSSGASGLVQALPCGKVPGSCFDPVDNLRWADGYAKGRYGSWASAYAFWTSNHWW